MKTVTRVPLLAFVALLASGCHGASVISEPPPAPLPAGQRLVVLPFQLGEDMTFAGDGSESAQENQASGQTLEARFSGWVGKALTRQGFGVSYEDEGDEDALTLSGVVTRYDRGSWALRFFIGFGAGASLLDTTVTLSRAGEPISSFDVQASSGTSNWVNLEVHMEDTANAIAAALKGD